MKRIIIIVVAIVLIGGIAFGIFYFLNSKKVAAPTPTTTRGGEEPNMVEQVGGSALKRLANQEAHTFFANERGDVTLMRPTGQIIELRGGQTITLASTTIPGDVFGASFSSNGKKLAVRFGAKDNPQLGIFDISSRAWQLLPQPATSFAWEESRERIAYLARSNNRSNLEILDLASPSSKPKVVASLREYDLGVAWGTSSTLHLFGRASAHILSSLWEVNIGAGTVKPIIEERPGLGSVWDEKNNEGLLFVGNVNGRGGTLQLINTKADVLRRLSFLTLPEKCAFREEAGQVPRGATSTQATPPPSRFLICAVPRENTLLTNNPMPDAYYKKSVMTEDDIYEVNLKTGDTRPLLTDQSVSMDVWELRTVGKQLFFINRFDRYPYSLSF